MLLVLVVCLLFIGIWTYQLYQGRERAITSAQATTANLARIIEEANNRTLQAIDLTLNNVEVSVNQGHWDEGYDANAYLRSLLRESPQIREVAFAGKDGRIMASSRREFSGLLSVEAETYFIQAREGSLPPFFISTPRPGRMLGDAAQMGQGHIIMARTVYSVTGVFTGVALAVINPGFFQELIYALDIGTHGYVAYYRYDGKLLMSGDSTSVHFGGDKHGNNIIFGQYLPQQEWGTFIEEQRGKDSSAYIVSYRATSRWPMLVVGGLEQDEVLTPWLQEARDFSVLMAGSLVVLVGLAVVVYSQHLAQETMVEKLEEAHHDALTGIPALRLCLDRLSKALSIARQKNDVVAVFFIDLDGFKAINDRHGHEAGDYVLQQVAIRLTSCVREMDTVGRLGGDEFLIFLNKIREISDVERIGKSIVESVKKPIQWKGEEVSVSASIGIALQRSDGISAGQLIRKADQAMYEAKRNGKNQYALAEMAGCNAKMQP